MTLLHPLVAGRNGTHPAPVVRRLTLVRAITRIEPDGDRVAHLRNYFFTSDFIAEVCAELGVPRRVNG